MSSSWTLAPFRGEFGNLMSVLNLGGKRVWQKSKVLRQSYQIAI